MFGGAKPGKWRKPAADEICDYSTAKGPFYLTDAKAEAPIRYAKTGIGALEASTVPAMFKMAAQSKFANSPALKQEAGTHAAGLQPAYSRRTLRSLLAACLLSRVHTAGLQPAYSRRTLRCLLPAGAAPLLAPCGRRSAPCLPHIPLL